MSGQCQVSVDADLDAVWDVVRDVTRVGEWSHECIGVAWLDGCDGGHTGSTVPGPEQARNLPLGSNQRMRFPSLNLRSQNRNVHLFPALDGVARRESEVPSTGRRRRSGTFFALGHRWSARRRRNHVAGRVDPTTKPTPEPRIGVHLGSGLPFPEQLAHWAVVVNRRHRDQCLGQLDHERLAILPRQECCPRERPRRLWHRGSKGCARQVPQQPGECVERLVSLVVATRFTQAQ